MKVREGFVSNSSSSSFVAIGKKVSLDEIDLDSGKTYFAFGKYLYEGDDIITVQKEHLDIFPYLDFDFQFMEVEYQKWESDGFEKIALNGEYTIWAGTADYNSSEDRLIEEYKVSKEKAKQAFKDGTIDVDTLMELIK